MAYQGTLPRRLEGTVLVSIRIPEGLSREGRIDIIQYELEGVLKGERFSSYRLEVNDHSPETGELPEFLFIHRREHLRRNRRNRGYDCWELNVVIEPEDEAYERLVITL